MTATRTIQIPIDEEDGGAILNEALVAIIREASDAAQRNSGTPLGIGTLCVLAALEHLSGRDWKETYLK